MFGSINTDPANTFTQSDIKQAITYKSKLISKYFENTDVQEKVQFKTTRNQDTKTADGTKLLSGRESSDELKAAQIKQSNLLDEDIDSEDEDSETIGILYDGKASSISTSFQALAAATGAPNDKVTKSQLLALLQTLSSEASENSDLTKDIAFVKNLIAKFDTIAEGENYITSFNGVKEPQDYKTITKEQVTSPIDIFI